MDTASPQHGSTLASPRFSHGTYLIYGCADPAADNYVSYAGVSSPFMCQS